jgi:hypothetical protein
MEYHGKQYSVILTIGGKWKWSAEIEGQYRSGLAISRPAGVKLTERAIDKALWSLLSDRAFNVTFVRSALSGRLRHVARRRREACPLVAYDLTFIIGHVGVQLRTRTAMGLMSSLEWGYYGNEECSSKRTTLKWRSPQNW